MVSREITVGRSETCDIYLDPRCEYASGNHGTIYFDGYQLVFKDTSSNGTVINGTKIKHQAVPIRRGDTILLAGKYQLDWAHIDKFFPNLPQMQRGGATVIDQPANVSPNPGGAANTGSADTTQPLTSKWSWGAFALYPIWGFFNGCWWAIFVWFFLGWCIIPSIVFGIFGRRWSWQNKRWANAAIFNSTQKTWDTVGLILFIISLVMFILSIVLVIVFWASLFKALS